MNNIMSFKEIEENINKYHKNYTKKLNGLKENRKIRKRIKMSSLIKNIKKIYKDKIKSEEENNEVVFY